MFSLLFGGIFQRGLSYSNSARMTHTSMPRGARLTSTVEILLLVVLLAGYALCVSPGAAQAAPIAAISHRHDFDPPYPEPQVTGIESKWIDVSRYYRGRAVRTQPSETWVENVVQQWRNSGEGWRRAGNAVWNSKAGKWVVKLVRTTYGVVAGASDIVTRAVVPIVNTDVIQNALRRCVYDEDGNQVCTTVQIP